jgi:enoyl-[acyl-carrier protein] reductase I
MAQLEGKIGLVFGVANKYSIAWAIAKAWQEEGAKLVFACKSDRFKKHAEELIGTSDEKPIILECDVSRDDDIDAVFKYISENFGRLDLLLHSIAFAPREALEGGFIKTSRDAFHIALDVSTYSLIALARQAETLMPNGGSIITMSYYGAEKVIPNYNVMGVAKAALEASTRYLAYDLGGKNIRINCISAGPVNTLSARGIGGFHLILDHYNTHSPLKRNVLPEEIGATAVFLASDRAAAITGQVIYVDCGYNIMGM